MNQGQQPRSLPVKAMAASLAFGTLAAALMAARILGYGESWSDRAQSLVIMSGLAGLLASWTCLWLLRRWTHQDRVYAAIVSAALFALVYLTIFGVSFVFDNRVIAGHFEPNPERLFLSVVFSSLQTAGMFVISAPRYLLPWLLPIQMMLAAALLPRLASASRAPR